MIFPKKRILEKAWDIKGKISSLKIKKGLKKNCHARKKTQQLKVQKRL